MVSYIRGEGLEVSSILNGPDSGWKNRIEIGKKTVIDKLHTIDQGGSNANQLTNEFYDMLNSGKKDGRNKIGRTRIKNLAELASSEERISRLDGDHNLAVFGKETSTFWELVKRDNSVILGTAGETDENVTVDVKRVIRWIGSLHGKCGLRVTEIPFERLDPDGGNPFDPLSESIVLSGGSDMKVKLLNDDIRVRLKNIEISGDSGDELVVNDSLATFLCLKGWASPIA
jgi:DNA primase small subunit